MPIIYNGNRIIPAPLLSVEEENVKNGDLTVGKVYRVTLNGTITSDRGSPTSSGTFWTSTGYPPNEVLSHDEHLKSLLCKQSALRQLFDEEGKLFEIKPWDESESVRFYPRVLNVNVSEGLWYNTIPYTITMETDNIYGHCAPTGENSFSEFVRDTSEEWSVELAEPQDETQQSTFRLTHNVSAIGRQSYTSGGDPINALDQAKNWVIARLGVDWTQAYASGVLNVPNTFGAYNHVRSQNANEIEGSFSVSESWILSSGNVKEDFTVETQTSVDNALTTVSINGSIEGFETRNSNYTITQTKYDAANTRWASVESLLLTRAQTYSAVTLNIIPNTYTVGKNPVNGIINYNYEYNDRPSNLISGALSETIVVGDVYPTDVFATLPILGRADGPLLQGMLTYTEKSRSLSIDAIVPKSTGLLDGKPDVSAIIAEVIPTGTYVFKQQDQETWQARRGIYSRQINWVYEV